MAEKKTGLHDSEPLKKIIDDYPERPYGEAMTEERKREVEAAKADQA